MNIQEIQDRHDEHQGDIEFTEHEVSAMQNDPDVDFDVSYSGADEAHIDRGYLLSELSEANDYIEILLGYKELSQRTDAKLAKVKEELIEVKEVGSLSYERAEKNGDALRRANKKLAAVESASNTNHGPEHDVVCPRACFSKIIKEALK
jgi:hypothetical protein